MVFEPGQLLLHRGFVGDNLVFLRTARVVAHDERGLRLWIAHGSAAALSVAQDGRTIRDMPFQEWLGQRQVLRELTWWGPSLLMFVPPERSHSIWWFWDARDEFVGWYINLEEPSVGWAHDGLAGVDVTDQDLDVWVYPDRSWEWKDEDEFAERLAFPADYWVPDPAAVRAEGEQVIKLVEAGVFPFDGTWCDFRPDQSWPVPDRLPPGWRAPRFR